MLVSANRSQSARLISLGSVLIEGIQWPLPISVGIHAPAVAAFLHAQPRNFDLPSLWKLFNTRFNCWLNFIKNIPWAKIVRRRRCRPNGLKNCWQREAVFLQLEEARKKCVEDRLLCTVSIPIFWELPECRQLLLKRSFLSFSISNSAQASLPNSPTPRYGLIKIFPCWF